MSRRIKLILTTLIILISIFILTKDTLAWSPNNQTPIYPQEGVYFCKEKGGAIRFTQLQPNYYKEVYNGIISEKELYYAGNMIKGYVKNEIITQMKSLAEYAKPIPSNSEQLKDYNGDFTRRK